MFPTGKLFIVLICMINLDVLSFSRELQRVQWCLDTLPWMELRSTALGKAKASPETLETESNHSIILCGPNQKAGTVSEFPSPLPTYPSCHKTYLCPPQFSPLFPLHPKRQESRWQRVCIMKLNCLMQLLAWFSSCVAKGKSSNCSGPQFSHPGSGDNNSSYRWGLWRVKEFTDSKQLKRRPAHRSHVSAILTITTAIT